MKKKSGFTLIELLIVIAIIGILAAVLVPNLLQARRTAQIRAEEAYVQNVYKVANAALAEDPNIAETTVDVSCSQNYTLVLTNSSNATYSAGNAPGTITACAVDYNPANQTVTVTYSGASGNNVTIP